MDREQWIEAVARRLNYGDHTAELVTAVIDYLFKDDFIRNDTVNAAAHFINDLYGNILFYHDGEEIDLARVIRVLNEMAADEMRSTVALAVRQTVRDAI